MIVKCLLSCATSGYSLVEGEVYDLPADVIKGLGSLVEPVVEDKPAPKKSAAKKASK